MESISGEIQTDDNGMCTNPEKKTDENMASINSKMQTDNMARTSPEIKTSDNVTHKSPVTQTDDNVTRTSPEIKTSDNVTHTNPEIKTADNTREPATDPDPMMIVEFTDNDCKSIATSPDTNSPETFLKHSKNNPGSKVQTGTDVKPETSAQVAPPDGVQQHDSVEDDKCVNELDSVSQTLIRQSEELISQTTVLIQDTATMMEYRRADSDGESSASVSSDDSIVLSDEDNHGNHRGRGGFHDDGDDEGGDLDNKKGRRSLAQTLIKTKGELFIEDLPPIEDLAITVGDDVNMVQVGRISSVIDSLVIIQSCKGLPPLNIDTVLFLDGRKVLGLVFETFGPVAVPLYSVRFNSEEQIEQRQIEAGLTIYYAPDAPEYTHYVFMAHLQTIKGSDASWEHNNEPPPQFIEYSDDEEERRIRKEKEKERRRHREGEVTEGNTSRAKRNRRKPRNDSTVQKDAPSAPKSSEKINFHTNVWPPKDSHSLMNGASDCHPRHNKPNENILQGTGRQTGAPQYRDPWGSGASRYRSNSEMHPRGTSPWSGQDRLPQRLPGPTYGGPPFRGPPPLGVPPPGPLHAGVPPDNRGPPPPGPPTHRGPPPPGVTPHRENFHSQPPPSGAPHPSLPITSGDSHSGRPPLSHMVNHHPGTMPPPTHPPSIHTTWPAPGMPSSGQNSSWNQPHPGFSSPPPHNYPPPGHTAQPPPPGHQPPPPGHTAQPPPHHSHAPPPFHYGNPPPRAMYGAPPSSTPPPSGAPYPGPRQFTQQRFGGRPQFPPSPVMSPRSRWEH